MFLPKVSKAFLAACILSASFLFASGAQAQKLPLEGYQLDVGLSPAPPFVIIEGEFQNVSGIDVDIIKSYSVVLALKLSATDFISWALEIS